MKKLFVIAFLCITQNVFSMGAPTDEMRNINQGDILSVSQLEKESWYGTTYWANLKDGSIISANFDGVVTKKVTRFIGGDESGKGIQVPLDESYYDLLKLMYETNQKRIN